MMRRLGTAALLLSLFVPTVGRLGAQDVAVAARRPRFFLAPSSRVAPVEIDAGASVLLRHVVSLRLDQPTVGRMLDAIERQAGIKFYFNPQRIGADRRVTLRADSITIAAALTEILLDSGMDVLLAPGNQVALVERTAKAGVGTGAVVGRVTDAKTGAGLGGVELTLEGTRWRTTTNQEGRYRLADVTPGSYTLSARLIGYGRVSRAVVVAEVQEATVDLMLQRAATPLEDVVVTGTLIPTEAKALPTPVTIITADEIERQHPRRFEELLRLTVPGAIVGEPDGAQGSPSELAISLRGLSRLMVAFQTPKIYVDGIEVAQSFYSTFDPTTIERIEVIRGPQAAAIYGSDAIGGVIQIFTKRGAGATRPTIETHAALGRIESAFPGSGALRQDYAAAFSGQTGSSSYRVGGGYRRTGDWMPNYYDATPSLMGATRIEQGAVSVDLSARAEQVSSEFGTNTILAATGAFPPSYTIPSYTLYRNRFETYGIQVEHHPVSVWRQQATVGVDRRLSNSTQYRPRRTTPDDTLLNVSYLATQRFSVGYRTMLSVPLGAGVIANVTAGAAHDVYTQDVYGTTGALTALPLVLGPGQQVYASREQSKNTGLFAEGQVNVREALFLTGSIRAEDNTNFGTAIHWPTTTRLGASYVRAVGGATVKFRASYGKAILAPFFRDRDSIEYTPGLYYQLPNPDLRPARQRGMDAGADLVFGRRGSLSVSYYNQRSKDFDFGIIVSGCQVFTDPCFTRNVNLGEISNTGFELEATLDLGPLTARGNFAVVHSHPTDLGAAGESIFLQVGKQFPGTPFNTAGLTFTATALRNTTVTGGVSYRSSVVGTDVLGAYRCFADPAACTDPTRNYVTRYPKLVKLNLSVDRQLTKALGAYLAVEDATNRGVARGTDNSSAVPGRISTLGLRARF